MASFLTAPSAVPSSGQRRRKPRRRRKPARLALPAGVQVVAEVAAVVSKIRMLVLQEAMDEELLFYWFIH
jgi:hypothetical protein